MTIEKEEQLNNLQNDIHKAEASLNGNVNTTSNALDPASFAQAWADIQKGEQKADELERQLDDIEKRLDMFFNQLDQVNTSEP